MQIRVAYCETCRDFSLWVDGIEIRQDYVVAEKTSEGHTGKVAEWEIENGKV